MSPTSDVIVVNTAELRSGAAALRRAAADSGDIRQRIPSEVWGAPDWLASSAADELGVLRGSLDELHAELISEADRLEARAAEVDGAERRWANVVNGELRCGCVLPSGEVVATPFGGTAASSASGPGVGEAISVGAVGLAAAGGVQIVQGAPLQGPPVIYSSAPAAGPMSGVVITQPAAGYNPLSGVVITQPNAGFNPMGGVIISTPAGATYSPSSGVVISGASASPLTLGGPITLGPGMGIRTAGGTFTNPGMVITGDASTINSPVMRPGTWVGDTRPLTPVNPNTGYVGQPFGSGLGSNFPVGMVGTGTNTYDHPSGPSLGYGYGDHTQNQTPMA